MIGQVVMLMMVGVIGMISFQVNWPIYLVIDKMNPANSVNPKLFEHGNTELNSTKVDKCVESRNWASQREDGVLRTARKLVECYRNDSVTYLKMCGNRLRAWHRHFSLLQHHRLVNDRERAYLPDSRYRSRFGDYNPAVHPHRQVCTGSYLN
jgi:hypothetical protein